MSYFDELLEFCNVYKYIYCYGAGYIGEITGDFLHKYGIDVKGYIETKKSKDYLNGVKVYSLEEIALNLNDEIGIIVSIDEKYQDTILLNLSKYGFNKIFLITKKQTEEKIKPDLAEGFISLKSIGTDLKKNKIIDSIYQIEKNKNIEFEKKYIEICNSYKRIIIGRYDMRHIGIMCLIYYLWNIEKEKDTLYVMFPIFLDNDCKKVPNSYFLSVIQEKIEIVTEINYEFWRWMLQYHSDKVEVSDYYEFSEAKKRAMDYWKPENPLFTIDLDKEENKIIDVMNLKKDYICVHNRDNIYYNFLGIEYSEGAEYASRGRNFSVRDFNFMAKEFVKKNIDIVRMGYKVEECAGNSIVDYASKYRTEKLDFYLLSKCRFFMTSDSGICMIAVLMGAPVIIINSSIISFEEDMMFPMSPEHDLIIMKKIWYPKQKRYLSMDEILYVENKYRGYEIFEIYCKAGMIFENNSPEELLDVANEMEKRLNGEIIYTKEEEELQSKYRKILESYVKFSKIHFYNGRFGTDFLKKNSWFLEEVPDELSIKNIL